MVHILLWDEQFSEKKAQLTELIFSELQSAQITPTWKSERSLAPMRTNMTTRTEEVSSEMESDKESITRWRARKEIKKLKKENREMRTRAVQKN
jgi:hypothetical protein